MGIRESIDLFNSKINQTYWTEQVINTRTLVVLPVENYYKILQKSFSKVGENSGTSVKFHTNNLAEYFANPKTEDTIAFVSSIKAAGPVPTKISIATYYAYDDKIAILNRFDQTGRAHDNHLDVYGVSPTSPEFAFYKKYLSDKTVSDPSTGAEQYKVNVPHIHFNTRSQTIAFNNHNKANAISVEKLIVYLNDLMADLNPSSIINTVDMGMPFLDLKNAKLTYTSTMLSSLQSIIAFFDAEKRIRPDKFSEYEKQTIDLMKSLINQFPDTPTESSTSPVSGGPSGVTPSGTSISSTGGTTLSFISSSSGSPVSKLTEEDLKYIIYNQPSLQGLNVSELNDVKSYLSKFIRQVESDRRNFRKMDDHYYRNDEFWQMQERVKDLKQYLKYIKGMINLESISADLKKYMAIYNILNERDPLLLNFVSKELLKNLTVNIKSTGPLDKGGVNYESDANQPQ